MAALNIGFTDGSLLRRTILHVATFVVGSIAFIGLMSFLLVTVVRGILPHSGSVETTADEEEVADLKPAKPGTLKPTVARKKPTVVPPGRPAKED